MDTLKVGDIVLITDENDQKCGLHATVLKVDDGGGHCQLEFSFEFPKVKSWYFDYQFDLSPDPARQQAQPADGEGEAPVIEGLSMLTRADGSKSVYRAIRGAHMVYVDTFDYEHESLRLKANLELAEARIATLTSELASTRAELAAANAERDEAFRLEQKAKDFRDVANKAAERRGEKVKQLEAALEPFADCYKAIPEGNRSVLYMWSGEIVDADNRHFYTTLPISTDDLATAAAEFAKAANGGSGNA